MSSSGIRSASRLVRSAQSRPLVATAPFREFLFLVAQAESYRSEIISRRIGIASALMEAEAVTNQYVRFLRGTLDRLEPKLRALLEKPTK